MKRPRGERGRGDGGEGIKTADQAVLVNPRTKGKYTFQKCACQPTPSASSQVRCKRFSVRR